MAEVTDHLFVDREAELSDYEEVVAWFLKGESLVDAPRVFEYVAIAGTGKSTLFAEFRAHALGHNLRPIEIDFSLRRPSEPGMIFVLDSILNWFALVQDEKARQAISKINTNLKEYDKADVAYLLDVLVSPVGQLISCIGRERTILFIDSAELCPQVIFEWFVSQVIQPLADTQKALIFIASRRELNWGRLNYRIKRRYLRLQQLQPLSVEATALQIEKLGMDPGLAPQIHKLSGGNGRATVDIVKAIAHFDVRVNARNFGDYERRLVESLHRSYIEKVIRIPEGLYDAFQTVSVLRRFNIDLPDLFRKRIDPQDLKPADWMRRLDRMRAEPEDELITFHAEGAETWYDVVSVVRKILALRLRFNDPELYAVLSQAAIDYYDSRFKTERRLSYIREKLYHLADLHRLADPPKSDVEIANALRRALSSDLQLVLSELYYPAPDPLAQQFVQLPRDIRVAQIRELQEAIAVDEELLDRLGDHDDTSFLDEIIESFLRRAESQDRLILSLIRTAPDPPSEIIDSNYSVTIQVGDQPIVITGDRPIPITKASKRRLLKRLEELLTPEDLELIGGGIWGNYLPAEVQPYLVGNSSPVVISVNDTSIPWELMHDGDNFLALKVPLGKLPITGSRPKPVTITPTRKPRVLLVGVAEPDVPGLELKRLPAVDAEIEALAQLFSSNSEIVDFNWNRDVLLGEAAHGWDFGEKLHSGRYQIIHFAGHAVYGRLGRPYGQEEQGSTQLRGLVLSDEVIDLGKIPQLVSGSPFVFLNACKTSGEAVTRYDATMQSAYSFLLGGALGCINSIWNVDDRVAVQVAKSFYPYLLQDLSVGEALLRTKNDLRSRDPSGLAWASYILLGYPNYHPLDVVE